MKKLCAILLSLIMLLALIPMGAIPVVYLLDCSDTVVSYAIRVVNIPTKNYDTVITATPYLCWRLTAWPPPFMVRHRPPV